MIGDYDAANDALAKARKLFEGEETNEAAAAAQVRQKAKAGGASQAQSQRADSAHQAAKAAADFERNAASKNAAASLCNTDASAMTTPNGSDVCSALTLGKPPAAITSKPASSTGIELPPVYVRDQATTPKAPPKQAAALAQEQVQAQAPQTPRSTPNLDVLASQYRPPRGPHRRRHPLRRTCADTLA